MSRTRNWPLRLLSTLVVASACSAGFAPMAALAEDRSATKVGRQAFEAAFLFAGEFAFSCLANNLECGLEPLESQLLGRIQWEVGLAPTPPTIAFKSGQADPAFFNIDGAVRIARTGNNPGDAVWVNTDLFNSAKDDFGVFPFRLAIATVIHEIGHHHTASLPSPVSHEALDVLGLKVAEQMGRYLQERVYRPNDANGSPDTGRSVRISVISNPGNVSQPDNRGLLMITDSGGLKVLSDQPLEGVTCPREYYRDDLDFEGVPLRFHLDEFAFGRTRTNGSTFEVELDVAKATVLCRNTLPGNFTFQFMDGYRNGTLVIRFEREGGEQGGWIYSGSELAIPTPPDRYWR